MVHSVQAVATGSDGQEPGAHQGLMGGWQAVHPLIGFVDVLTVWALCLWKERECLVWFGFSLNRLRHYLTLLSLTNAIPIASPLPQGPANPSASSVI